MSGFFVNGMDTLPVFTGAERLPLDTQLANGVSPQSASVSTERLATLALYYSNNTSKTPVAGSRYFRSFHVGDATTLNGIQVLVGATGGTDKWIVELHDVNGNLLATSNVSGTTTGTAGSWQQIPFGTSGGAVPYAVAPGDYFITLQSNGTTASFAAYNAPSMPINTGSATGTFGTGAAITPPTTYTQAVGPLALLY
jgi:hypothetical protein